MHWDVLGSYLTISCPGGAIFVYQLLMQKRVRCCICLNSSVSDNFFNF